MIRCASLLAAEAAEGLLRDDETRTALAALATTDDDGLLEGAERRVQALLGHDQARASLALAAAAGDDRLLDGAVGRSNPLLQTFDTKLHAQTPLKEERKESRAQRRYPG